MLSTAKCTLLTFVCTASLVGAGCGVDLPESDLDWGLGEKADGASCDPSGPLCWPTADIEAMRGIVDNVLTLVLGNGDPVDVLRDILRRAELLSHKLTSAERQAAQRLRQELESISAAGDDQALALGARIHQEVLKDIVSSYAAAFSIPVGLAFLSETGGAKADGAGAPGSTVQLTPDMQESLQAIKEWGVVGQTYAWFLESGGCLTRKYEVLDQGNFREWAGKSREARVDSVISSYKWRAAGLGLVTGAEPGVFGKLGTAFSLGHESYYLFQYHACMTFEIAAIYGWDIRVDRNLHQAVLFMISEGAKAEIADVVLTNILVPELARPLAKKLGIPANALAKDLAAPSLQKLWKLLSRKAKEEVAEEVAEKGIKAGGRFLLRIASIVVSAAISAVTDLVTTDMFGWSIAGIAKQQLGDLMIDGTVHLADQDARDCMFDGLSAIVAIDGKLDEREKRLYQAFLSKQYYSDEGHLFRLSGQEPTEQACRLRRAFLRPAASTAQTCIKRHFELERAQERIDVLGHLYAMARVDGYAAPKELELYEKIQTSLMVIEKQLAAQNTGPALSVMGTLKTVERKITYTLQPGMLHVDPEYQPDLAGLRPEEILGYLATPDPKMAAVLNQAMSNAGGICGR